MFGKNEIISQIGRTIVRRNVMAGSCFKYINGNGSLYASLGHFRDHLISAKFKNDTARTENNPVASLSITPITSNTVGREVAVEGICSWILDMDEQPTLATLEDDDMLTFGQIFSLKGHTDKNGQSHLYVTVGNDFREQDFGHLLLKLTADDPAMPQSNCQYVTIPKKTFVAKRGYACLLFQSER